MNIKEYLRTHKITPVEFANEIGVVRQTVAHWLSGRNYPNRYWAKRIERVTKGVVTLQDIYG